MVDWLSVLGYEVSNLIEPFRAIIIFNHQNGHG